MSKRWFNEHRADPWRRKARQEGYRARSAYKLKQIQEKFPVLRKGDIVLDVGCAPGGWTQIATEAVGDEGLVIGVDLQTTAPVEGAHLIVGDIRDDLVRSTINDTLRGRPINTVISDISPDITGRYDIDQAVSIELVGMVADYTLPMLNSGGAFIAKIFQGPGLDALIAALKRRFSKVHRFSPVASRNASSEIYIVCRNLKPHHGALKQTVTGEIEGALSKLGIVMQEDDEEDIVPPITGFTVHRRTSEEE